MRIELSGDEICILLGLVNARMDAQGPVIQHKSLQGEWTCDGMGLAWKLLNAGETLGELKRMTCFRGGKE